MDYPSLGRDFASLCRDTRARPSHRRDRSGFSNHRRRFPSYKDPSSQRDPTRHKNGSARIAVEPILLSTGSNDRARRANPNRSHPTL